MTDTKDLFAFTINPTTRPLYVTVHHDIKLGSIRLVITDGNPKHATVLVTPVESIVQAHVNQRVLDDLAADVSPSDVSAVGIPYGWASTD